MLAWKDRLARDRQISRRQAGVTIAVIWQGQISMQRSPAIARLIEVV